MGNKISRRTFLKTGTAFGVGSVIGGSVIPDLAAVVENPREVTDLAIVNGENYFENTMKAVRMLGGIGRFNVKGAKVAVLVNSSFSNPGTIVNPDIAIAVIKMCFDAGAREVTGIPNTGERYWNRSSLAEKYGKELEELRSAGPYIKVKIPGGTALKEAEVAKGLLDCDVFINIPIAKNHAGTHYTGVLKNMMGACPYSTNSYFHMGKDGKAAKAYEDVDFLSQCIADLNLLRKPDLCVVDATEFITTNGPFGPGKLKKLHNIVAGTDRVLVDAYCCTFLGLEAKNVAMITMARQHQLGSTDVDAAKIKRA